MPSSTHKNHSIILDEVMRQQPKTVLDIGIGYGKWAFLMREYLESWKDRVFPHQWKVRIEGIEIFPPYAEELPWQHLIYDDIYLGDAHELIKKVGNYDLIIAGDVVEHLTKDKGEELIREVVSRANCAIFSIPIGDWMNNMTVAGNDAERHQAIWEESDFDRLNKDFVHQMVKHPWEVNNRKGMVVIWKR